ncbi:hypothetical protein CANARDRAFT_208151 [[Candida] arabinofermentans NRRL YB-2248]|uniref:Uncharacterized protein n=1 Tax=[Candida] arabinofermentans NRRL YB-2248 TaxID=983967 RepID=A0A1E4SZC5_9ASCO|nr:hypothetical protein CANARDRAFT_208151 [[Candida] arabinofermentans NRRL YB-2248]
MLRIIQGSQIRYFCTRSVQLNKKELTEEQLAAIQNLTSTLYQPVNPFSEPSKASEIEAKIQSIQERLLKQQKIEEERYAELVAQQHELLKPTLSDFKRPLTSFFLLGSAVYLLIQYTWSYLEGEEHLIELDDKCKLYEVKIQELLDEQKNKRKWFWWF